MRKLDFLPARHGFHFTNLFINQVSPGITTSGLCGGMALAAARYWLHKLPIPTHRPDDFPDGSPAGVPPPGSPLQRYIYDCQMASYGPLGLASAANWVTMPWITHDNQFEWSVNEFEAVRKQIDAGLPVVLGLRQRKVGEPFGHQVLAYGYDEARREVFIYDPNYADAEHRLCLDFAQRKVMHTADGDFWSSYFVTGCATEGPRPPYVDLGLQLGLNVTTPGAPAVGGSVSIDVCVRNFGFRAAHVRQLFVYVRGPRGENLDGFFGGDNDPSPIPAGGERRIQRTCPNFGRSAGNHTIGVSYLSEQGHWIGVPPIAGGTRNEVTIRLSDAQRSPGTPWRSLGGVLTAPPAAAANADGHLEVFGRGMDSRIYRMAQQGASDFSGWELLGGSHTFNGQPAVAKNHWQKLELFARGRDGALWHRWQNDPNVRAAAQWSQWQSLGGQLAFDPSVALNHDERLEVFAVHGDGRVFHIWQRWFDAFGAPWSGWEPLGARRFRGRVSVERDGAGRLWAFARSRDDESIWRCHQTTPSGPWTEWEHTGGLGAEPFVGRNADGRLEVFLRGLDGKIWHAWQMQASGGFSGWELLRGDAPRGPILDAGARPTAWQQADGALAVVAVEGDGEAWYTGRTNQAPWWSDPAVIGSDVTSEIAAAAGGGQTGLFALGPARDLRVLLRRP